MVEKDNTTMKNPTIYDIKYDVENSKENCYFFSRDTLKFFGQTMKSFKVVQSPTGRIFIYAKMYDHNHTFMGYTFREYKEKDLISVRNDDDDTLHDVLSFIQSH
jgi:hypothetical protein